MQTRKCFSKREEWRGGWVTEWGQASLWKGPYFLVCPHGCVGVSVAERALQAYSSCPTSIHPWENCCFCLVFTKRVWKFAEGVSRFQGSLESWSLLPRRSCKLGSRWSQCKDRGTSMEETPHLLFPPCPPPSLCLISKQHICHLREYRNPKKILES